MATQIEQDLRIQKLYILGTGSMANANEMAGYNASTIPGSSFISIEATVDNYLGQLVAAQGVVMTIQDIARNGFGVTLTTTQAQGYLGEFIAAGIDSGSKLLNFLSTLKGVIGDTLDNRAEAASNFLAKLSADGNSSHFTGLGMTTAVTNLLQNIDNTNASFANATTGFNALSTNLSFTGITGTVSGYLSGATVFADANRDGMFNTGEWSSTTTANGTLLMPNIVAAGKIIVYGGTDLMTGNPFQGLLSATAGSTVVNPLTTLVESMVNSGQTVNEATTAIKGALGLPTNINLLSYNPLAVLASSTATPTEKAVALSVQATSQQISNIITHTASVIDNATPGATLQSAAAAVTLALAQAVTIAAASATGTIDLANVTTLARIIQESMTATGSTLTPAQVAQIAQITAGSNTAADAATNITQLAQAADVAQGSATNALIAGATSGNFDSAVTGFTGSALTTANYNVTVGEIAPGVATPPTASQIAADEAAAAAASAAASAARAAPTATLSYSTNGGITSATTASVKDADTLTIIATFNKPVSDNTPTILINNGILSVATAMTKIDSTHYSYTLDVPAGDFAAATVTIDGARDGSSRTISATPTNAVFTVDNTAPAAPTAVTVTPIGGTVVANTLNTTNTNVTATATIAAAEATGGTAVLKVGATTIATDATILAGDTSVTFSLGTATTSALQTAVAAGGIVTVTLIDAAGNTSVSSVANPTLTVAYTAPSAPTDVVLTPVGGTVVSNSLNNTNTNLTAVATIVAGQATGGSAVLKIGDTIIATDTTILIADTTVEFDLSPADNAALQAAVAAGGVATVTLIDVNGNATVSALDNPTLAVDYVAAFIDLTTAVDNLSGSISNDVFSGTHGDGGLNTFNIGDILDGLDGTDTLKITTGAMASTPSDLLWTSTTNFEKVVLQSLGNGAQSFTSGPNFEAAFADNGVDLEVETLLGAIDVTMTGFTGTAQIKTTTIGAGAHTIVTGTGAATVEATGLSAGAQTINGVGLTTVDAIINGGGDQVIGTTLGGNLVTVNATILGAGSQTIQSTSDENVTIVAEAASGDQTITTAGGNDKVTTIGAAGKDGTISTGAGDDIIVAGLSTDLITGGTGSDTMTGGGGVDTFAFGVDGSLIGTAMDIITDFNTAGADILSFGGTAVLLTADATLLVAGVNVNTSGGGLITFDPADDTLAKKIIAIQADLELDLADSVAMFVDGDNTYVYYAGTAPGNADDQLIQLSGITTLTTMIGGATLTIS
ncbi:MAG: calcium-binding protein [Gammaproteobacteria bacterium]|nr:calcium-binding protein [Gammaproteobacteria bacterium]